nr:MAG TPA: NAF domain [Bacteriophage sp.]
MNAFDIIITSLYLPLFHLSILFNVTVVPKLPRF